MKKLVTVIVLLIGAGAVTVQAQSVKVAADPRVDLSKYKTYAWAPGTSAANPIINALITETVNQALTAKGLTQVSDGPDVTVAVMAALNSDLHISYPSWGRSVASATSTGMPTTTQSAAVSKGTLVVDIADGQTKATVWRGIARHTLDEQPTGVAAKDAKNVEKPIRKSVEKMFKRFPVP